MFGGVNPKQMAGMMKKMGISQEDLQCSRVVFETPNGNLVIDQPDVMKIMMQGQETYQVVGKAELVEDDAEAFSEDDVEMVMGQTGKDREAVVSALKDADGDIAEAIVALQ